MKSMVCTVFNVEHGLSVFVKSPSGYGMLIDCGSRPRFSPVKWIRQNYNVNTEGFKYYQGKQYAEMIVTHLHADHFSDIGSLKHKDEPKTLSRDKETLKFLDEKIREAKKRGDKRTAEILEDFKKFSDKFTQDAKEKPDWGLDFYRKYQLRPFSRAEKVDSEREKIINNRSYIIGIAYAGKKIMIPGDMEVSGWEEALEDKSLQDVLADTDFFVASHHGHKSGFTSKILDYSGKPDIFIISARSGDESIDSAYGKAENSKGYRITGETEKSHSVSTRRRDKSIEITVNEDGTSAIVLLDTPDNLNENQATLRDRRTRKATAGWGM